MSSRFEMGSEIELSLSDLTIKPDNIFDYLKEYNTIWLESGRSAIRLALDSINEYYSQTEGKVLLPDYLCESIYKCFDKEKIEFYRIKDDLSIDFDDLLGKINNKTKIVFVLHYFGEVQNLDKLQIIKRKAIQNHTLIIEDTTHSIFSNTSTIGDYMVCSLRKWVSIPQGGVLYCKQKMQLPNSALEKSIENRRSYGHVLKRISIDNNIELNELYREYFRDSEDYIDNSKEIKQISDLARFLLSCTSIKQIVNARKQNYRILKEELGIQPINSIKEQDCPYAYVISAHNRDLIRAYLIDNKIYCAVHWPYFEAREMSEDDFKAKSNKLLSLPIDQRYGEKEMRMLASIVNNYINNKEGKC